MLEITRKRNQSYVFSSQLKLELNHEEMRCKHALQRQNETPGSNLSHTRVSEKSK